MWHFNLDNYEMPANQNHKKSSKKFIDALEKLPDIRDNRGKRHSQVFVITVVVMAILSGRSRVSSIHRYINNQGSVALLLMAFYGTPNSNRLIKSPITMLCIRIFFEKQIVLRTRRLIRVRQVKCLRSIFCVFRLPTMCSSATGFVL